MYERWIPSKVSMRVVSPLDGVTATEVETGCDVGAEVEVGDADVDTVRAQASEVNSKTLIAAMMF